MATIVTRAGKGTTLSWAEMDANFNNINTKLTESISVKDFGAVGDGTTNDSTAIQNAVNLGGTIWFPTGTYKIGTGIQVGSNTSILCEPGAIFDISAAGSANCFYGTGTFGSAYALTANASVGALTLSLSAPDAANLAAGDWVQVYSTTVYDTGWSNATLAEIVRVLSVSGTTVTLREPLRGGAYNTASAASVRKCNFIENVFFSGGKVIGSPTAGVLHTAIRIDIGRNCHVDGWRAESCNGYGVNYRNSIFCSANNLYVTGNLLTAVNSYAGVNFTDTCQDCTVTNSVFVSCHHAVTNTFSAGGICRRITYENCKAIDSNDTGDTFDTHANIEDVTFLNCVSYNSAANGFNLEGSSGKVIGCSVFNAAANGIAITLGATTKPASAIISGCQVDGAATYGIRANQGSTVNSSTCEQVIISNSVARNCQIGAYAAGNASFTTANVGISDSYFNGTSTSGSVYIGDYVSKFRVSNTHAVSNNVAGSAIQVNGSNASYGTITGCIAEYSVSGANGVSSSAAIRLTDCNNILVSNNIVRQPASSGGYGIRTTGTTSSIYVGNDNKCSDATNPGAGVTSTLTIASGAITLPHGGNLLVTIDTEASAATDDLDTISGGVAGQLITLNQANSSRDPTIKDDTGNLRLAGDFTMTAVQDSITLIYNGSAWIEVGRADIA